MYLNRRLLVVLGVLSMFKLSLCDHNHRNHSHSAKKHTTTQPMNTVPYEPEGDPGRMLQSLIKSNDSQITGALHNIFGTLAANVHEVTYDDPNVSVGSSSTSSEDSSSWEDYRKSIPIGVRKKRELTLGQVKKKLAGLPKSYYQKETPWNQTHNLAGIYPRLFRYRLCDLKYLRNICLYNIISSIEDACEKYKCTETVLPRAWEVAKLKCRSVMENGNSNPVWNGTFYYNRNGKLSNPIRNASRVGQTQRTKIFMFITRARSTTTVKTRRRRPG